MTNGDLKEWLRRIGGHSGEKTFCSACKIHCYRNDMAEKIRKVMRYSGPRIIFHHPILATTHVYTTIKQKREERRKEKLNVEKIGEN